MAKDENGARPIARNDITAMPIKFLERRSWSFSNATSGKGKPMTYGTGKKP